MPRKVKEWIGKTDDTKPPKSVRARVFDAFKGTCQICKKKITPGEPWHLDHIQELRKGGVNSEKNLAPTHAACNLGKAAADNSVRAKENRQRQKHIGVKGKVKPIPAPASKQKERKAKGWVDPNPQLPQRRLFK